MRVYRNFKELQDSEPQLAKELWEHLGEGGWQNNLVGVFDSYWDIGEYELYEGRLFNTYMTRASDINILDYIECDRLGKDIYAVDRSYIRFGEHFVLVKHSW